MTSRMTLQIFTASVVFMSLSVIAMWVSISISSPVAIATSISCACIGYILVLASWMTHDRKVGFEQSCNDNLKTVTVKEHRS